MMRKIIPVFFVILFLAAAANAAVPVEVVSPKIEDISLTERITGSITPFKEVNIPAEIGGIVNELKTDVGNSVRKDDILLVLDKEKLLIQLKQAEASLAMAEANYRQLKNGATEEEIKRAEASYQQAVSALEGAESNLLLVEEIYSDKISLKQQLTSSESQLANAKQQLRSAEENFAQAQFNFEQAEREYERMKYLYEEKVITEKQFEAAENQFKNSKSALNTTEISVEQAKIGYNTAQQSYELTKETFENPIQLKQQLENAKNQVKSAEAGVNVAQANLEQVKKGSRQEQVDSGLAQVKQAEASLEQAKLNLKNTEIRSPIDGIISVLNTEEGELISTGQIAASVININKVYLQVNLTAASVSRIEKGNKVDVYLEIMRGDMREGIVTNISPAADPQSKSYPVKIELENADNRIKSGMFADAVFTRELAEEAVTLPVETVVDVDSDDPYVFLVKDGRVVKQEIAVGITNDDKVEILSGIKEGDVVVIRGQNRIDPGAEVEVLSR
ncbi:MAG: efflux RND transporter periplasmic adaptor subunit [Bacillota bacterium]